MSVANNQAVAIRLARVSERKELEALQWRASLNNPGDREALLAHPDAIELPLEQIANGRVFVIEVADTIVGFAAIVPRDDGDSELDALFVEPSHWRQGLGNKLVDYCAQVARELGARALHVIGNPHAESFYLGCGFETIRIEQTRFGPGLLMRKLL
jgi:GNAT superfamily N-acetyltransferase